MLSYYLAEINYNENDSISKDNEELIRFVFESIKQDQVTGRLIVPALWKKDVEQVLSNNLNLSKSILFRQKSKLDLQKLTEYDKVIKDQYNEGVIDRIDNVDEYVKNCDEVSFLPHGAIFKENVSSTKCRVVFFSNLKDDQK